MQEEHALNRRRRRVVDEEDDVDAVPDPSFNLLSLLLVFLSFSLKLQLKLQWGQESVRKMCKRVV